MASIYSNENFPQPAVEELRALGHDVLTTHEAGQSNKSVSDQDVLKYAAENKRVLLTLNRIDFIRLHNKNDDHAGVLVCTMDLDYKALSNRIHDAISNTSPLSGRLVRVNMGGWSVDEGAGAIVAAS